MTTVNIDHLAALDAMYQDMIKDIKERQEAADALKQTIQQAMGDNEVALIGGKPRYTYRHTGQFNASRFATEHPELMDRYTVMRPALDQDSIAKDMPELFTAYRARRFESKA